MTFAAVALRLLVLLALFIALGALITYTRPGRTLTNILAALIGGTDTDEGAHHG